MTDVVLYGRRGCHLCDEARSVLVRVRRTHPFALVERDIEADESLLARYLERIPVVTIDGVEAFELFVDEADFTAAVATGEDPPTGGGPSRVRTRS